MLSKTNNSYKWIVLAISFMLMVTFAISLQSLPPIFDNIGEDISFTNSQAGMLMGAYAIPGIFLPFLVAFLAKRFNIKFIILVALITLIVGLIAFSLSGSFITLLAYRLIAGIGATVLVVLAPLLITMFFDKDNIGIAMGIFNTGVPFGTVIAANLFGVLGEKFQWRSIILGIAAFVAVVLSITFFLLYMPQNEDNEDPNIVEEEYLGGFWSNWGLWLLALIWALTNAQLLSYTTFAPQFYQSSGMTTQKAGLLTSLIMLIPIFLSPIVGIIIDRTGWKKRLLLIGSLIIVMSLLAISKGLFSLSIWAATLGLGFSPIPVLIFSLLPEMVESHHMGMGLGLLTSASNMGIAIGPIVFGALLDRIEGNFAIGFIVLAFVSIGNIIILERLGN